MDALEGDFKNDSFDTGKFSVIPLLPGTGDNLAIRSIGLLSVCYQTVTAKAARILGFKNLLKPITATAIT